MLLLRKNLYEFFVSFLLLIILFFPTKYFFLYYGLIITLLFLFFILCVRKCRKSIYLTFFIILSSLIFFNSSLSFIYFGSDFFRNSTELVRYFPVILILASFQVFIISFFNLYIIFSIYVLIATLINFMQFSGLMFADKIAKVYNDPIHVENALKLANRSLGLSGGPGPNGIIFVILFVFFFTALISKKYKFISLLMMSLSTVSIFLSQSQTAFIALALTLLFILFIFFFENYNKKYFYYIFSVFFLIIFLAGLYLLSSIQNFKYLNTLFEQGLGRSSYQNRELKFSDTMNLIDNNLFFYFIGHGKDYIPSSSALDNEYLFVLSVYGILGLFLFILFYIYNIVYLYLYGVNNIYKYLIFFTCFSGLIVAWPNSFLLDPRILFILVIYIACYLRETKV